MHDTRYTMKLGLGLGRMDIVHCSGRFGLESYFTQKEAKNFNKLADLDERVVGMLLHYAYLILREMTPVL